MLLGFALASFLLCFLLSGDEALTAVSRRDIRRLNSERFNERRAQLKMAKTVQVSLYEIPFPVKVKVVGEKEELTHKQLFKGSVKDSYRKKNLGNKFDFDSATSENRLLAYSLLDLSSISSSDEDQSNAITTNEVSDQSSEEEWKVVAPIRPSKIKKIATPQRSLRNLQSSCLKKSGKVYEHRTYPRSYEFPGFEASVPRKWDWRNVSGENFCSPTRNQHIPVKSKSFHVHKNLMFLWVYCGSCWVFGSLGSLNDRFNVARKNRWPMTMISPQEIIDCNGKGNCQGGEVGNVYDYAKTDGLVEEGCNNYKAVNGKCDPFNRCGTCWPDKCNAIQNFTRFYVKDYGKLSGRLNMMSEIHNRGPIACSIGCTEEFDLRYTGGIYRELSDTPTNHIVSVTGWGYDRDSQTEYWIVRNSWGEAWGECGWFRIVTSLYQNGRGDMYNLGIERDCYFADPDTSNLD